MPAHRRHARFSDAVLAGSLFVASLVALAILPGCRPATLQVAAADQQPRSSTAQVPLPGEWKTLSPAPTRRTEVAAAAIGGSIYVVGGFAAPSLSNLKALAISDLVEDYDPETDRWSSKTPLPVGLHHVGIASHGHHLYVAGGFTKSFLSVWSPVATLYRFDPQQNAWTKLASMPTARGALTLVELSGKLLAIGGYDGDRNTGAVELYDPATNAWDSRASLPTPRDHLTAAVVDGRVYAIGGRIERDYARNLGVVEAYDPGADRWSRVADLPTPRSGITAAVIDGVIYVLGGEAPQGTFRTNEAYVPAQNRWTPMAPMPTGRHGLGSAVVGKHLYALSGGPSPGGSFSDVNERFTPPQHDVQDPATPPRASARHVGTIMALLAVFQDAGALPPEQSPEANQLIKALIQFQAAFMRSEAPSVQRLLSSALASQQDGPATAIQTFRRDGWTSESLEAIVEYVHNEAVWERPEFAGLQEAFRAYHVDRPDLELLTETVRAARKQLAATGKDLHAVYAARRQQMPGS